MSANSKIRFLIAIYRDIEKMTKYGPDANLEKRDLPSSMRDPVQARKEKVDLESGIGKTKAISFENGNNGKGFGLEFSVTD